MSRDLSSNKKVKKQSASPSVNIKKIKKARKFNKLELQFYESVNNNPSETFEILVDKCLENNELIPGLATKLCYYSSWVVCRKVFATKELNKQFIEAFYTRFFPEYLKLKYSWLSLDLLIRASTVYPEEFTKLLRILVTSVEVPKQVLIDYVVNVNSDKRNDVMKAFCRQRLTLDQLKYQLRTLNIVFLSSEKSPAMCQYIAIHLVLNSLACFNNRDYGRLLLSYVENYHRYPIRQSGLKKLIDTHRTEYKGPCMTIFEDIVAELAEMENQIQNNNIDMLSKVKKFEQSDEKSSRMI